MAGKQAVVFGGTSGIGKGVALRLARARANVCIVGRSVERGNAIVEEMKALAGDEEPVPKYEFAPVDATSIKAVRGFAKAFAEEHEALDVLVLSQGIATTQGYTPTKEGLDMKLALHYFSRVAATQAFMPLLEKSSDARVLTVLSGGVHSAYAGYKTDFTLKDTYSLSNAANAAGFYNDIAVDSLAREHPGMTFVHACPGFVNTNWGTEMPWFIRYPVRALQVFGRSPEACAEYMCNPLFAEDVKGGYKIVDQYGQATASTTGLHEEAREAVWAQTKQVLAEIPE